MKGNTSGKKVIGRRTALRTLGGALALGIGLGSAPISTATHQENHAEIKFNPQRTTGESVTVAKYEPKGDGFITIHTWDLIDEQDGPGTICGVSELIEPGKHRNIEVTLFEDDTGYSPEFADQQRLEADQRLVAVPHRDIEHTGEFDFTGHEHTDIPFTNGTQVRDDLPVDDAVNDWAYVRVVPDNGDGAPDGASRGRGRP